jgi:hypothetical protein
MVLLLVLATPAVNPAAAETLEQPLPVAVPTRDHGRVAGQLTEFDAKGFTLTEREGEARRIAWTQLPASRVFDLHRRLLGDEPEHARAWLELAHTLRAMDRGFKPSEAALNRATRLDDSLEPAAARVRDGQPPFPASQTPDQAAATADTPDDEHEHEAGPKIVGTTQADLWGDLSPEFMARSVEELKAFAEKTQQTLQLRLALHETDHFLFYSDLGGDESVFWARQLEDMYDRLCHMFDLDNEKNIFRGKCLIVVFRKKEDYQRFQREMHQTDPGPSSGMCHGYGNGFVHVAFYRQPDKWDFAHLLVHESVHAFLHRYRSPVHIPSWANEGLAETIAAALVPKSRINELRVAHAEKELRQRNNLGQMFEANQIEGWQYGPARLLTEFMIAQDKKRYANFINGIKDGKTWRESLTEIYGVELARLVHAFGNTLGVRNLTP